MPLLPAELAWYVTGRFYQVEEGGPVADYGYFLHLPFLDVPLFHGKRSEGTAHFTFAAEPFQAHGVGNGGLQLGVDPVGSFSLYLQREPAGTFDDPDSFARGERIATFRRASLVVGTTVTGPDGAKTVPLVGTNVFSARLVDSTPFDFAGGRHDIAEHLGAGVTQFGTAAGTPVAPAPPGFTLVVPFTGSAIALGR
ncbi:hypothetical protein [Inquilinus limosus]|uniref:Uncharacterized protein n=1 Tax=Inquilinus limosus MP06 TaxID=1398085 RepID=A0A0A0DAZ1_9PROT|nr:hypothetical protein [Inquilinus limosus]KGM35274.1 hypothetical protein P409_05395 [Inquilinus limosus MP06]